LLLLCHHATVASMSYFHKRLKYAILKYKTTPTVLANELGVTVVTVNRWLRAKGEPTVAQFSRLCYYFQAEDPRVFLEDYPKYEIDMSKVEPRPLVKRLVEASPLSSKQVAEELGISASQLSRWASGRAYPTEANRKLLTDYFDIPEDSFESGPLTGPDA
jgi:transcriptional regulator with XRE-family HTH domain